MLQRVAHRLSPHHKCLPKSARPEQASRRWLAVWQCKARDREASALSRLSQDPQSCSASLASLSNVMFSPFLAFPCFSKIQRYSQTRLDLSWSSRSTLHWCSCHLVPQKAFLSRSQVIVDSVDRTAWMKTVHKHLCHLANHLTGWPKMDVYRFGQEAQKVYTSEGDTVHLVSRHCAVFCFVWIIFEIYLKILNIFKAYHILYCTWFFHVYSPGSREQISGSHRWPSLSGVAAFEFWVRVHFVLVWLAMSQHTQLWLWKPFWSFFDFACNPPISVRDWWWFAAEQCSSEHTRWLADFIDFDPPIEVRIWYSPRCTVPASSLGGIGEPWQNLA